MGNSILTDEATGLKYVIETSPTGRMSCECPNLQNIPMEYVDKKLIRGAAEFQLIGFNTLGCTTGRFSSSVPNTKEVDRERI